MDTETHKENKSLNPTLWRYMPYDYFESLLNDGLYFHRIDKFDDKHEGIPSKDFQDYIVRRNNAELKKEMESTSRYNNSEKIEALRKRTFVNCWNISNHENYLMWEVYAKKAQRRICKKNNHLQLLFNQV